MSLIQPIESTSAFCERENITKQKPVPGSSATAFNGKALFGQLLDQQIPVIALNLNHPVFQGPPAAALGLQPSGQLGQGPVLKRDSCNQAAPFTLASIGFPANPHNSASAAKLCRCLLPAPAIHLCLGAIGHTIFLYS